MLVFDENPNFNESVQGQWKLAELKFPMILRSKLCATDVEVLMLARISDYQVRPPGETQGTGSRMSALHTKLSLLHVDGFCKMCNAPDLGPTRVLNIVGDSFFFVFN